MGFWTVWFCVEFVLVSAQPKAHTHSCTGVATFHFPFFAFKTRPCLKDWLHYIQNVLNCALRCVSTAGGSWAALFVLLKCGACWHQEDGHTIVPLFHIPPFKQKEEYIFFFFPSSRRGPLALTACYTQKQCRASCAEMSSQMAITECHRAILREEISLQCWAESQNFRKRDYFGPQKFLPEFLIVFSLS